ncbi:MAG TPA: hypothetical protein VFM15_07555 [Gammaproteobacteria bacterium]|nr:hypothetical protein [Gammaproteobacteria bacterium]
MAYYIDMEILKVIRGPIRLTALLLAAGLLAACASYAAREHAHYLHLAQQDDASCGEQGWHYPAPRYVTCRMKLQDARQYRDWMNLQLMHQTQARPTGIAPAYPYKEAYRPLNRDHYSCRYTQEAGQDYILCSESEHAAGTPPP